MQGKKVIKENMSNQWALAPLITKKKAKSEHTKTANN